MVETHSGLRCTVHELHDCLKKSLLRYATNTIINLFCVCEKNIFGNKSRGGWDYHSGQHSTTGLCSLVVRALDSQLARCDFDSRPPRCRVTTFGKLFTPLCLCRSQRSSGTMHNCGMRRPRFESHRGQLFSTTATVMYCTALCTGCVALTAVPRSTQPSILRGKVKQLSFCAE